MPDDPAKECSGPGLGRVPKGQATESDARLLADARALLQQLLSRPEGLFGQGGDTYSLADLRQTLSARPLIQQMPDGKWQWLFDFWGHETPPPATSASAPAPAPIPPAAVPPSEFRAVPSTPSQIEQIRSLDKAIRDWSDGYLNLNKLANEIRLLDLTPAWASFDDSAVRYLSNIVPGSLADPLYPSCRADEACVTDYLEVVLRGTKSMKRAFFLAELLAFRPGKARDPSRLDRCLRVVAFELGFHELPFDELASLLATFQDDILLDLPSPELVQEFTKIERDPDLIIADWLGDLVSVILRQQPLYPPASVSIPGYFSDRFEALMRSIRTGEPLSRVRLSGLRLRVDEQVPSFRGDPNDIPLAQYARVLRESEKFGPPEFPLGLLCQLGFGAEVEQYVLQSATNFDGGRLKLLISATPQRKYSGDRVFLLLREPPDRTVEIEGQKYTTATRPYSRIESFVPSRVHAIAPGFWLSERSTPGWTYIFSSQPVLFLLDGAVSDYVKGVPSRRVVFIQDQFAPAQIDNVSPETFKALPVVSISSDFQSIDDVVTAARAVLGEIGPKA